MQTNTLAEGWAIQKAFDWVTPYIIRLPRKSTEEGIGTGWFDYYIVFQPDWSGCTATDTMQNQVSFCFVLLQTIVCKDLLLLSSDHRD